MITQEEFKEQIHYDPETGIFTNLVNRGHRGKAGEVTGNYNPLGYVFLQINNKKIAAHRAAFLYMTGSLPPSCVDHINGNPSDNRWSNLRAVTRSENQRNCRRRKDNTSGFTGVTWDKQAGKWKAQFVDQSGKRVNLGVFKEKSDAIRARQAANRASDYHQNHGESRLEGDKQPC